MNSFVRWPTPRLLASSLLLMLLTACTESNPGRVETNPDTRDVVNGDQVDATVADSSTESDTEPAEIEMRADGEVSNDDDNDSVLNVDDACPAGASGWTSSPSNDVDADGCRDSDEDTDDDNDGVSDTDDQCPNDLELGTDTDGDGCTDPIDTDGDGVADPEDNCPTSADGWISSYDDDLDHDGCPNDEDTDDDGDGVSDDVDVFPTSWNPDQTLNRWTCEYAFGGFRLNSPPTLFVPLEIVQESPQPADRFATWYTRAYFVDGKADIFGLEVEDSEVGVIRLLPDAVGTYALHTMLDRVADPDGPICGGLLFEVVPPPDIIYVQAQLIGDDGQVCAPPKDTHLPTWADPLVNVPLLHVALDAGALVDQDGDGELDPWDNPAVDCNLSSCGDAYDDICRSEVACSEIEWVAGDPTRSPSFVPEHGLASYGMLVPPPVDVAKLRIAVQDRHMGRAILPTEWQGQSVFEFISYAPNPCQQIRIRVWAYGRLVHDQRTELSRELWDVGDLDVATGAFTPRGVCTDVEPTRYCSADVDCEAVGAKCGPKKWPKMTGSSAPRILIPPSN